MSETLTPPQLAQRYGVKVTKVLTWIATGQLRALNVATKVTGRPRWRITPEAIDAFETSRTAQAQPAKASRRRQRQPADYVTYF